MVGKKRCPVCNSTQTHIRLKTQDYQCYTCGHSWDDDMGDEE